MKKPLSFDYVQLQICFTEGIIKVKKKALGLHQLENMYSDLRPGGRWCPSDCLSQHHVAIIIPYRDRPSHLKIFLRNIHPFLQKQQLDYALYVIEMVKFSLDIYGSFIIYQGSNISLFFFILETVNSFWQTDISDTASKVCVLNWISASFYSLVKL